MNDEDLDAFCDKLHERWKGVSFTIPRNSEGQYAIWDNTAKCRRDMSDSEFELSDSYEQ
jgi:hypothetical protein